MVLKAGARNEASGRAMSLLMALAGKLQSNVRARSSPETRGLMFLIPSSLSRDVLCSGTELKKESRAPEGR